MGCQSSKSREVNEIDDYDVRIRSRSSGSSSFQHSRRLHCYSWSRSKQKNCGISSSSSFPRRSKRGGEAKKTEEMAAEGGGTPSSSLESSNTMTTTIPNSVVSQLPTITNVIIRTAKTCNRCNFTASATTTTTSGTKGGGGEGGGGGMLTTTIDMIASSKKREKKGGGNNVVVGVSTIESEGGGVGGQLSRCSDVSNPIIDGMEKRRLIDRVRRTTILYSRIQINEDVSSVYEFDGTVLGTGISGAVRVARHRSTHQKYAIKTLVTENISSKKKGMLHNEVSIYLLLDHPNIVKLFEVYEDEKAIHLVMELCTGKELYDRLATKKKFSERDAMKATKEMLSAINYCHKHHICHRDLKLENWVYSNPNEDASLKLVR